MLAAPGTSALRLGANESGYRNLLLAGDWILTAMNLGCGEAATLGGLQAAQALDPGVRAGIGDWLSQIEAPVALPAPPPSSISPSQTPRRELPRFIVRDGDLMATPPIGLRISVYNFVLEASYERLSALCDAHLNIGGTTRYRPLAPFVVLYASSVDNYPIPDPVGWVPETDFGIYRRILDVKRVESGPQESSWEPMRAFLDQSQQGIGLALRSLQGLQRARSDGWEVGLDFANQLGRDSRRGMRKVFLKQVPDVVDGRKACYQAIGVPAAQLRVSEWARLVCRRGGGLRAGRDGSRSA